jgi:peptide/nickel transport system permease protein
MKVNEYQKKLNKIKLKRVSEYTTLGFSIGASLIMALLLFLFGLGNSMLLIASAIYFITAAYMAVVMTAVKKSVLSNGEISPAVRKLGIPMLLFVFVTNFFGSIAGFSLINKKKSIEYQLCTFMVLNTVCVVLISLTNLFKESQAALFWVGIIILMVCLIVQIAIIIAVAKHVDEKNIDSKVKWIMIPSVLSCLTGNVFALALVITIYKRLTQKNKEISIEWIDILRRCFKNYTAVIGLFIVGLLVSLSICSYFTFDYTVAVANDYSHLYLSPTLAYPFGTDNFGRCIFSRIIFGARISIAVGLGATIVPLLLGSTLGAIAGYYGKTTDNVIMRVLDIIYAVPVILLAIAIIASFGASVPTIILSISIYGIPVYARIVRAQVMTLSEAEYVEAAKASGATDSVIILKHIIPNSLAPVIVRATLEIGTAILTTSALSYLGVGIPSHIPEWGNLLNVGSQFLEAYPYMAIFPGIAIVALVLSFNFFGDGLRDALDPKMK